MSSQKKKFKLTKKFKDDVPPLAPKKANPMEPPEEAEDQPETKEQDDPGVDDEFLTKFRMKKRTMEDLCQ